MPEGWNDVVSSGDPLEYADVYSSGPLCTHLRLWENDLRSGRRALCHDECRDLTDPAYDFNDLTSSLDIFGDNCDC